MDTILSSNLFRLIVREFPTINKIIDVSSAENFYISILIIIISAWIYIGWLWNFLNFIYNLIFKSSKSDIKKQIKRSV